MTENDRDIELHPGDALLVVDVQNDFLPGGALAIPAGERVIPPLNRYIALFEAKGLPVFASRDWHPAEHCSFTEQGGSWPAHCVQHTRGAAFATDLALPRDTVITSKAGQIDFEAYSAFEGTALGALLRERGVKRLFIGGLATDYCVLSTVQDALAAGLEVVLLEDAVQAVDLNPGDGEQALETMRRSGARGIRLESIRA